MESVEARAQEWIVNGRVGVSSRTIWAVMTMGRPPKDHSHPHDPDDLNRCLLLLEKVPEWRSRLPEMSKVSPFWGALVDRFADVESCFLAEVGLNWSHGDRASKTYDLMRSIYEPVE